MTDDISKALRDSVDWLIANHIPYSTSRLTAAADAFDTLTADLARVTAERDDLDTQVAAEHNLVIQLFIDIHEARRLLNVLSGQGRLTHDTHFHIDQFLLVTSKYFAALAPAQDDAAKEQP